MIRWIPYTFVRTVLFFMGGILLGLYTPGLISARAFLPLSLLFMGAYFAVVFVRRPRRFNPGWVGLPLVFFLGYAHIFLSTASNRPEHLANVPDTVTYYEAVISRYAEERERSWRIEAVVNRVRTTRWTRAEGTVLLYFSKEDFSQPFQYGEVVLIRGQPQRPSSPGNPGEFDYAEYLALRNIYHVHYLRGGDALKTGYAPASRFLASAFRARAWAERTLNRYVGGPREQGIASALVLGVTDGLDEELLSAYSATGSMHILAVSGLHISVLYFLLMWMLSPVNRLRGGAWIVALVSLVMLWFYAFVTGMPPSVLRAVTMFSFLALARPWSRNTNIYNTLAVSAFCLLLFDPFLIRSVGFQLSYMAVLGIVFLYRRILVLWEPRHALVTEVWKISCVAIAAQLATFPLGMYYFHQFPNYFLLSNLIVVPVSFVVLIGGLGVLLFSFVPLLASVAGFCLAWVIRLLNGLVMVIGSLPFSYTGEIYINGWQCLLLAGMTVSFVAVWQHRRFSYVVVSFVLVAAFAALQWYHFLRRVNVQQVTVYRIPGHLAMDLTDRGRAFFVCDSALARDPQRIGYHVTPNRILSRVTHISTNVPVARKIRGGTLFSWQGKTILLVNAAGFGVEEKMKVDWLMIGNNALSDIRRIREQVAFTKVILDTSNSFFFASRFLEEGKLYKLDIHSVWHQGAFVSKIQKGDT